MDTCKHLKKISPPYMRVDGIDAIVTTVEGTSTAEAVEFMAAAGEIAIPCEGSYEGDRTWVDLCLAVPNAEVEKSQPAQESGVSG